MNNCNADNHVEICKKAATQKGQFYV